MKVDDEVRMGRARQRLSQEAVANLAGVSRGTVARIEADDRGVSLDSVARVLRAIGRGDVTLEELAASWGAA